jgi:hypothetical protein
VRALAGVLRIGIALDRSHAGHVNALIVRDAVPDVSDATPGLDILVSPIEGADISLELQTADERKSLLEEVMQRRVKIEAS